MDGIDDADPKTNPGAKLIPEIDAATLKRMALPTRPIEPVVPGRARLTKSVRIGNGLKRGNLTRALAGEAVER